MVELLKIREHNNIACQAAEWFHQKLEAYTESIKACLTGEGAVPQWYIGIGDIWVA